VTGERRARCGCSCGETMVVASTSPQTVQDIAGMFAEWHSGPGHDPVSYETAAAIRRKARR
jgi:hypothetical protein